MNDPLTPYRGAELPLPELVEAAAALLQRAPAPEDERVSAVPDARTIRYYQSLGLVERPGRYAGRVALYGLRQLVQVVAVKLLQAQGHSLGQIQRALAGLPHERLEAAVLSQLTGAPAPSVETPPTPITALVTAEIAPGVIVTVDPRRHTDPQALIARMAEALNTPLSKEPL